MGSEQERIEIIARWMCCFQALNFVLNSVVTVDLPDMVRNPLEECKTCLEDLVIYYEDIDIKKTQVRA